MRMTVPVAKVLSAFLADVGEDRYGLDLMKITGLPSGTLYPILQRLQEAGWVDGHWEQIDPVVEGRPARRYYRLTADGAQNARVVLAELHAQTSPATPANKARDTAHGLARGIARGLTGGLGSGLATGSAHGEASPAW